METIDNDRTANDYRGDIPKVTSDDFDGHMTTAEYRHKILAGMKTLLDGVEVKPENVNYANGYVQALTDLNKLI